MFTAPTLPNRGRTALAFVLAAVLLIGGALGYRSLGQRSRGAESGLSSCFKAELSAHTALSDTWWGKPGRGPKWREAEADYRAALKSNPRLARARRGLAAVVWLRGDTKSAREIMRAQVDIPASKRDIWRATQAAYGTIPKPTDVATLTRYKAALRAENLGWSRYVALQALASNKAESRQAGREMRESYEPLRTKFAILGGMGFLGFIVGLAVLAFFFSQPQCDRLPRLKVAAWPLGAAFLVGLASQSAVAWPMRYLIGKRLDAASDSAYYAVLLLTYALGAALAAAAASWTLRRNGTTLSALGWAPRRALLYAIGGYVAIVPVLTIATLLSRQGERLLPNVETPMNSAEWMAASAHGWSLVPLFLTVCVVGPWVEELLFRGLLFRSLQTSFGFWGGAILSSAAFAALHPQLPLGFLPIWCIGIGLCVMYRRTGSLTACWLLHGLNNTVAMVLSVTVFGHLGPLW